ncbi:MAG: hypothetical protein Q8K46_07435 [Deltaproteobacteria bacterium]|nr:hypothetical protein [Deltaproteobacteria bacterium]
MQVVKAIFDGKNIHPIDLIKVSKKTEVLVIFPSDEKKYLPQEARKRLRGSCKGDSLTEKLLKSRTEDINLE